MRLAVQPVPAMKPLLLTFFFIVALAGSGLAQDAIFVAPEADDFPVEEAVMERRAPGLQGIIAQILRAANPLQLLNPFAPSFYGTGEANVSQDESFSQSYFNQPCLTVFGVEFE
jgi:hypothetical protein